MTLQKDSEHHETKHLHQYVNFANKRVLEVGCGEGRLTWQYAEETQTTMGIDLDRDSLRVANIDRPHTVENKVHFACADSQYSPFSKNTFDIAILAWSL